MFGSFWIISITIILCEVYIYIKIKDQDIQNMMCSILIIITTVTVFISSFTFTSKTSYELVNTHEWAKSKNYGFIILDDNEVQIISEKKEYELLSDKVCIQTQYDFLNCKKTNKGITNLVKSRFKIVPLEKCVSVKP